MPGPPGAWYDVMRPGDGTNVYGSSALMRHSIAWPRRTMSRWRKRSFWPAAMRICCCTMSMPVIELGDRVLDLHARVHLDEEELVVLVEELERAGAAVADLAAGIGAALADARQRARG